MSRCGKFFPKTLRTSNLDLSNNRPLRIQLHCIPVVRLLLAVFETSALVVLQQPVHPAEMTIAESAVADNTLGGIGT
jgi:hypothetical protein